MARLQILELPEGTGDDRPPFLLVIDQAPADLAGFDALRRDLAEHEALIERIGARAVLVFEETIDIPANDTSAYLGDYDVRDAHDEGGKVRDKDAELRAANEWIERLHAEVEEARQWARHGYEIGQRHCGWTDHGVAPTWLTDGWPPHIDSCKHLKQMTEFDTVLTRVREARERIAHSRDVDAIWCLDQLDAALGTPEE